MLAAPVPLTEDLSLDRTVRDWHCVCMCVCVCVCVHEFVYMYTGMCAHSWQREGANG